MNDRNRAGEVEIAWQSLTAAMVANEAVHPVKMLVDASGKIVVPDSAGVYAFWWMANKGQLLSANRRIRLHGPNNSRVEVEYHDWWPSDVPYPCLYVGKATNLKKRFGQHLMRGTPGRAHHAATDNEKGKARTTACQLRFGIEHIFPREDDPLSLINKAVGYSWCDTFPENAVAERFFAEDRLVGYLRPWFNIDSER
ncbi:GIY-YIG nuclease family protein [Burkholderia sp. AU38729]|uniref:GIY-YIG nuclease family protein n=1 Tax=Burkholderia sp. AU38729 TaxID=2879633 RepID=UPI001CF55626|nr:GIY-YIG nuclease family protein [Burkholderia sp. AU38729]MCA8064281.1 GIY-YIG nuclease family protein [Burkholderia sp. AU38729]